MIQISKNAAEQIQKLKSTEKPEAHLRIKVIGGGCSGLSYKMEFSTQKNETDKIFKDHGISIVIDPKSYLHLLGTRLDFSGGLNGKGFTFENPNAKNSCGCGSSFAV